MLAPPLWMTICAGCYVVKKIKDKKKPGTRPHGRPTGRQPRPGGFSTTPIPGSTTPPGVTVPGSVGTPLVHPGSLSIGPQANRAPRGRRRGRVRRN